MEFHWISRMFFITVFTVLLLYTELLDHTLSGELINRSDFKKVFNVPEKF
jgi:hypothetical protein